MWEDWFKKRSWLWSSEVKRGTNGGVKIWGHTSWSSWGDVHWAAPVHTPTWRGPIWKTALCLWLHLLRITMYNFISDFKETIWEGGSKKWSLQEWVKAEWPRGVLTLTSRNNYGWFPWGQERIWGITEGRLYNNSFPQTALFLQMSQDTLVCCFIEV